MATKRSTNAAKSWWLQGGEYCEHCCQLYVYEAEYRCTVCDGPICIECAIVEEHVILCPSCQNESESSNK